MTQKQKGYAGIGAMVVLAAGVIASAEPIYNALHTSAAGEGIYAAGTYTGSAEGFGGSVVATVTVSDSAILSVELQGSGETPALGGAALETLAPAFVTAGGSAVDAVSGCTITSNAAMEAVQQALDQAALHTAAAGGSYTAGTYTGSAEGFGGSVVATVTVSDSAILSVELQGSGETPDFGGAALETLAPAFVTAGGSAVDAVSGCTITSNAAMEAVQQALDQAAGTIPVAQADGAESEKAEAAEETKAPAEEEGFGEVGDYTYDGGLRTGMATVHSMKKSKDAGEADGVAQVDSTVAAVIIDNEGVIISCKLDIAQSVMNFTADGKAVMKEDFKTKKELGEAYGMKAVSGIGKEWDEQARAFEQYAIGKTAKEIAGIAVDEKNKATDADLSAGVTVAVGGFQQAVINAIRNAEEIGTQEGDTLGLAIVTDMHKSKDAAADADGQCQAYSTYMVVTTDEEGVITGAIIDASQGTVKFNTEGKITSDINAGVKTKRELGDAYGMKKASGIGKEWFEQADAMEEYMTGKTAEEIAGLAVDENGKTTDADLLAGVTVAVGDFQKAAAKAVADAE